ncbi:MAG: hypothetical protein R2795_11865 [Saprospiraceae bacterium]
MLHIINLDQYWEADIQVSPAFCTSDGMKFAAFAYLYPIEQVF